MDTPEAFADRIAILHFTVSDAKKAILPAGSIAFGRFGFPYNTAAFTLIPRPLLGFRIESVPGYRDSIGTLIPHRDDVLTRLDEADIVRIQELPSYNKEFPLVGQFFAGDKHKLSLYQGAERIGIVEMFSGGKPLLFSYFSGKTLVFERLGHSVIVDLSPLSDGTRFDVVLSWSPLHSEIFIGWFDPSGEYKTNVAEIRFKEILPEDRRGEVAGGRAISRKAVPQTGDMTSGTVLMLCGLPPWPPTENRLFWAQTFEGLRAGLAIRRDGSFSATFFHGTHVFHTEFQRLTISGTGPIHLGLRWTQNGLCADLFVNGFQLAHGPSAPPHVLTLAGKEPIVFNRIYEITNTDRIVDVAERLFVQTVLDIDASVVEGSEYQLIVAAGRLRLLLLDGSPLIHQANRRHKLKLLYEVWDFPEDYLHSIGEIRPTDPMLIAQFANAPLVKLTHHQFLALPALQLRSKWATVRDVIAACANAKGGVHFGTPDGASERVVLEWDEVFRFEGREPSLQALSDICRVALRGMAPLIAAILR